MKKILFILVCGLILTGCGKNNNTVSNSNNANGNNSTDNSNEESVLGTPKGIVYLDPTDLAKKCTEEMAKSNTNEYGAYTGVTKGCMKFYIYDDSGNNYTMILDHNTSGNVAWNYDNSSMDKVAARLLEDTKGWVGNPRLITESEIRKITNNQDTSYYYFDSNDNINGYIAQTDSQKKVQESYAWLFDNLYESTKYGGTISDNNKYSYETKDNSEKDYIYGYWTSSAVSNSTTNVWRVDRYGFFSFERANTYYLYGVRPVITLAKSSLQ